MDQDKPINILEELLKETTASKGEHNFEKIKKLVKKTTEMRAEERDRSLKTEEYFKTLRKRIDESSSYLEKAKKDLENINFSYQRDRLNEINNMDYEAFSKKTDEEIDAEMELVKSQLENLECKVKNLNDNTCSAEEGFNKSLKTLENISKGIYKTPK